MTQKPLTNLSALNVRAQTDEDVLLAVRGDGVVVALTAAEARHEYGEGRLTGWTPLNAHPLNP